MRHNHFEDRGKNRRNKPNRMSDAEIMVIISFTASMALIVYHIKAHALAPYFLRLGLERHAHAHGGQDFVTQDATIEVVNDD